MSGGERKRAALALAFALDPDLLLLDEPTNHLDVDGIETLEELLQRNVTCVVITHDRRFLDQVATRASPSSIAGVLRAFPGNYSVYEQRKAEIDAPRISRTAASRSSGRRKKCGSARASRRGARATKAA